MFFFVLVRIEFVSRGIFDIFVFLILHIQIDFVAQDY